MREANLYVPLWQKYLPIILIKLRKAISTGKEESLKLSAAEFAALGSRVASGYGFNLEIKNGKVSNDISGSAVARDLLIVLQNSPDAKAILSTNSIKINNTSTFNLIINRL